MPNVFISHTTDAREYAMRLREALSGFAEATVLDDIGIAPDRSISAVVQDKLKTADYVVVLLTERAVASPWIMFEIGAAQAMGKRIVAVLLADLDLDKLDYLERDRTFLDARNLDPAQAAERVKELAVQT